jgi:hypothetical protein
MSQKAVWFREQAQKCLMHASNIWDRETEVALRKLAAEYIERAKTIEENLAQAARLLISVQE